MRKKICILIMLLILATSLCACGDTKISNENVRETVNQYLESGKNPLRETYLSSDYKIISVNADKTTATVQIYVTQESEKTHYEVSLLARYHIQDGMLILQSCSPQNDETYYPLQELNADTYLDAERMINQSFGGYTYYEISPKDWNAQDNRFTAQIVVQTEYETYIDTIQGECELYWDLWNEDWYYDHSSYRELNHEIDFSPLNGSWKAQYSHSSTYLTKSSIPYTFTFSNAGRVQIKNGTVSATTINVDHELNKIWSQYLAPEWADTFPRGTNYKIGTMEIVYENSGQYFLITFDETNVQKMFGGSCQLRIDERQIIFYDAMVSKNFRLSR